MKHVHSGLVKMGWRVLYAHSLNLWIKCFVVTTHFVAGRLVPALKFFIRNVNRENEQEIYFGNQSRSEGGQGALWSSVSSACLEPQLRWYLKKYQVRHSSANGNQKRVSGVDQNHAVEQHQTVEQSLCCHGNTNSEDWWQWTHPEGPTWDQPDEWLWNNVPAQFISWLLEDSGYKQKAGFKIFKKKHLY